jgi:nicotinamidase-related amidase
MTERLPLDPTRAALLVMDYQVGLVHRIPDADALLRRVSAAIADVRSHGGHVAWVRIGFDDDEFDAIPPSSVMARSARPDRRAELRATAAATQIHQGLSPQPHDIAVRKTRVGAFSTTGLGAHLKRRDVCTLVLAGISTSGVVLSTVREAMDRDYRIIVLADACADLDPDTHAFLTRTIFPRHATVIDVSELPSLLSTSGSSTDRPTRR